MPVSFTYGQMSSQIAYELGQRTDLLNIPSGLALSPIQQAIQNAIAKWEREHFYFNEVIAINAFSTVSGQEFYGVSSSPFLGAQFWDSGAGVWDGTTSSTSSGAQSGGSFASPHFDKIWILVSNNRYTLTPRTEQYLSDISVNPNNSGQPVDYSIYAETLRLYPIPDGVYPLTFEGVQRFSLLINSTDTNVWLQDAANLIKAEAKCDILENILKQTDLADRQRLLIYGTDNVKGYLDEIRYETDTRQASNKVRPVYF